MKKILIALALILSITAVNAQPKTAEDAKKAVEKALAASQDAKKAAKVATWINLAKAYVAAYEQPTRNLLPGTPQTEVKLFIKDQMVVSTESDVKGTEGVYSVDKYNDKDLYYNNGGILEFFIVTKPAMDCDMLAEAQKSLEKAKEVDASNSKAKEIAEMMEDIHSKLGAEALANYLSGDFAKSSELFEKTADCFASPVLGKVDSLNIYYTGMVASMAGDKAKAIKFYNKAIDMNYYQEGNVFSNLAEIYHQDGDTTAWKATLEKGFESYPQSQGVLVGLINLYRETNDDPNKMITLLRKAQENEPDNASLYYVEGDIYKQLGDIDNAVKSYQKSYDVNNEYVFGILGIGILYYENAVKIQEKAGEEMDDNKFNALMAQVDENLEKAIEPFEKSFSITQDDGIKTAIAEYLKNIYFRLRAKSDDYQKAYEKYNSMLKEE